MDQFQNHYSRGLVLYGQKRYDLAEKEFGSALTCDSQNSGAHAMLGMTLCHQGYFLRAKKEAEEAIRLAPDNGYPHYALSVILGLGFTYGKSLEEDLPFEIPRLMQNGSSVQATRAAEEAVRLAPEEPGYLAQLAYLRVWSRRWNDGLAAADRGLARNPNDVGCLHVRALALTGLRRKAEAAAAVERFVSQHPDHPFAHKLLGLHKMMGKPAEAEAHLLESLRMDPTSASAQRALGQARNLEFIRVRARGQAAADAQHSPTSAPAAPAPDAEPPDAPAMAATRAATIREPGSLPPAGGQGSPPMASPVPPTLAPGGKARSQLAIVLLSALVLAALALVFLLRSRFKPH
jgi:tetratricopeptide (TPR) repeat protein